MVRMAKSENPAVFAVLLVLMAVVAFCAGLKEGVKLRECPAVLEDGRRLIYRRLADDACMYEYSPRRPLDLYSPTELRRIAAARERSERIKP